MASNKPDIALFINSLGGGGAERVILTLCNTFAEDGKKVHLLVLSDKGEYSHLLSPKVELFNLQRTKVWYAIIPMMKYLLAHRPPHMLCFLTAANALAIIANISVGLPSRIVVSERAVYSAMYGNLRGFRKAYRFIPLLYHFAEKLICVSQGVADDIKKYVSLPAEKLCVILNPSVRPEILELKNEPVDHPWLVSQDSPVVLAVGGFRPEKNYPLLLDAFSLVNRKHGARLLILGQGSGRATMEQQIQRLGMTDIVDMPGFKTNPYAYMARASVFVMYSDSEGLPNALIEALACGCPVIAADCPGGMREILGDNKYGELVPKHDPQRLARAIEYTLENLDAARNKVTAFNQEKVHNFMPQAIIPQYAHLLGLES